MKTRLLIIGIIAILVVSIIALAVVYNQEIKLITGMMKPGSEQFGFPQGQNITEIINYKGKNCGPLEILDRKCFVDAFTKCMDARISKTITTIEGDPITTYAFVNSTNLDACKIDVYRDTTQDRFSNQLVYHYSCSLIIDDGEILQIGECIPLEHGRSERFVFGK